MIFTHAQSLANTAWAYAKAKQSDAPLLRALARFAERRVGDFSAQELAKTAWAYAKAGQSAAPLLVALGGPHGRCTRSNIE